ncbi:unnamed protein product [Agarophyton chilense]
MGKRRFAKASKAADAPLQKRSPSLIAKGKQPSLHRGRKKRLQTKHRIEKKNEFIQSELERIEEEKLAKQQRGQDPILKSLNDLSGVLELDEKEKEEGGSLKRGDERKGKLSSKQRLRIVDVEKDQVKRVQTHEAYLKNPMDALRRHLNNTVCPNGLEMPSGDRVLAKKTNENKKRGQEEKKGKIKNSSKITKYKSLTISESTLQKARDDAKQRVESKRQYKQALSEIVRRRSTKQQVSKIQKQSATSLLSKSRIGIKRTKLI